MSASQENEKKPFSKKERAYLALIVGLSVLILLLLILYPRGKPDAKLAAGTDAAEKLVDQRPVERLVEVEREVTVETIEQGLRDMGVLIAGEYYFTDVITDSTALEIFDYKIPFTESRYIVRYDGSVSAGIDLAEAWIVKNDEQKKITVHIPPASVQSVQIDFGSFEMIEEKDGIGTSISVESYGDGLKRLEMDAKAKAVDLGLLKTADKNVRLLVSRFVGSLVDTARYSLEFVND